MRLWLDHPVGVLLGWLVLPVAALPVVAARIRRHVRAGVPRVLARRRGLAEVAAVVGTVPWLVATFTPQAAAGGVVLMPLRDLAQQAAESPATFAVQVAGNLAVLAALGFFAPMASPRFAGPVRLLLTGLVMSTAIEVLQCAAQIGRVASVDDVLLNTVGAVLAGLASRRWWSPPASAAEVAPAAADAPSAVEAKATRP